MGQVTVPNLHGKETEELHEIYFDTRKPERDDILYKMVHMKSNANVDAQIFATSKEYTYQNTRNIGANGRVTQAAGVINEQKWIKLAKPQKEKKIQPRLNFFLGFNYSIKHSRRAWASQASI